MNPTLSPTRKVAAAGIVGIAVTLVVFLLNNYVGVFQAKPISAEFATTLTTLLSTIVAYFTPPRAGEGTVVVDGAAKTGVS